MTSLSQQVSAAITIQRAWRNTCLKRAERYIDTPELLQKMERATAGQARVYFPENLPQFVLKTADPSRRNNISQAQEIIARNQFKHLVVPKVWQFYNGFLVEQRLPINVSPFHQMEIYLKYREEFSGAIAELAEFFCQAEFADLSENGRNPLGSIGGLKPRYDNLPLYVSPEGYFVGLIDLEHLSPKNPIKNDTSSEEVYDRLSDLILFFPYHLDPILAVAKKHCENIDRERFLRIQQAGLKLLNVAYEGYLTFLKAKGITCENPDQPLDLSEERKNQFLSNLSQTLDERFQEDDFYPQAMQKMERFSEMLPLLKSALPQVLEYILKFIRRDPPKNKLISTADLLSYRETCKSRQGLLQIVGKIFWKKLKDNNFDNQELIGLLTGGNGENQDFLLKAAFNELVKGGEIYYFDPCEVSGGFKSTLLLY